MNRLCTGTAIAAANLIAGVALAQTAPVLPSYGHYVGYGTIVSAKGCPATDIAGSSFQNQMELNTPTNWPVVKTRQVYPGAAPSFVPTIVKMRFERTQQVHLSDYGNVEVGPEDSTDKVAGTYVATYTALDPNSFLANVTVSYPYTADTGAGTCNENMQVAYIRSSAD